MTPTVQTPEVTTTTTTRATTIMMTIGASWLAAAGDVPLQKMRAAKSLQA
jgi:hypothetical protein